MIVLLNLVSCLDNCILQALQLYWPISERRYWLDLSYYCWYSRDDIWACGFPLWVLSLLRIKHFGQREKTQVCCVGSAGCKCFEWNEVGWTNWTAPVFSMCFLFQALIIRADRSEYKGWIWCGRYGKLLWFAILFQDSFASRAGEGQTRLVYWS